MNQLQQYQQAQLVQQLATTTNNEVQPALAGWFGRFLKKAINAVASFADSQTFGIFHFSSMASGIGCGGSSFWARANPNDLSPISGGACRPIALENLEFDDVRAAYEPNSQEEAILDQFVINFTKILDSINADAGRVLNAQTAEMKAAYLTTTYRRIAVVQAYYKVNATTGLSPDAIQLRDYLIEFLFDQILSELTIYTSQYLSAVRTTTIKRGVGVADLKPFNTLVSSTDLTVSFEKFGTNIQTTIGDTVTDVVDTIYQEIDEAAETVEETTGTEKQKTKWWLWLLLGYGAYRVVKK